MRRLFPDMTESLNGGYIIGIGLYWIIGFVVFPFFIPLIGYGLWDNTQVTSWIECIYLAINGLALLAFLKPHLSDTWLNVQLEPKRLAMTAVIACVLMLLWTALCEVFLFWLFRVPGVGLELFPVSEMSVALTTGYLAISNPIVGTLCLTVFAPISVTGLFYATGFAPICRRTPWLAYLVIPVVLFLPVGFDMFWRGDVLFPLICYAARLPVHLLACWTYQRSDTPFTPMVTLGVFNLFTALANILLAAL